MRHILEVILFPIAEEISQTKMDLIAMIKTTGKEKNYELIEYISDVNTQYTQVLMELNENGAMDAAYTYGTVRLTEDRFTGESNFYLYDPAGNVAGITDQDGYLWQSYRYDAFGNATFGSPQYDNEYTFNAESYNPNIHSQYLRARYYDTLKGSFLTEDSYLGDIKNPLTLNRYSYCIGNPLLYSDPSGHDVESIIRSAIMYDEEAVKARDAKAVAVLQGHQDRVNKAMDNIYNWLGEEDRSSAEQFLGGFVTGFVGSFYATYDTITNPEEIVALAYHVAANPVGTMAGIFKNAVAGNSKQTLYYIKTKNYRALGQEIGYSAGKLAQVAIARAAVKKCGELLNKRKSEINPLNGLPKNQGYSSFNKLKKAIGSPGANNDWHHIVEQSQIKRSGFTSEQINNTSNIIAVDYTTHMRISAYYSSKPGFTNGLTVRDWLSGQDFYTQYNFGLDVLKDFGVIQ